MDVSEQLQSEYMTSLDDSLMKSIIEFQRKSSTAIEDLSFKMEEGAPALLCVPPVWYHQKASKHASRTGYVQPDLHTFKVDNLEAQILDPTSRMDFFGAIEDVLYIPNAMQTGFIQDISRTGFGDTVETYQRLTSSTYQHAARDISAIAYDQSSLSLHYHKASSSSSSSGSSAFSSHLFPVTPHYLLPRARDGCLGAQCYDPGHHPSLASGRLVSYGSNAIRKKKRRSKKIHRTIRAKPSLPTSTQDAHGKAASAPIKSPKSPGSSDAHQTNPGALEQMLMHHESHGSKSTNMSDTSSHSFPSQDGPPNLFKSFSGEQEAPPQEDLSPSDPNLIPIEQKPRFESDLYTPRWIRGHGTKREGWCGLCRPGRWLRMKNSTFWYDKSFTHGISATTGLVFQGPLGTRRGGNNSIVWEGFCGHCGQWVPLASMRGKGTAWFKHAYKCHKHMNT